MTANATIVLPAGFRRETWWVGGVIALLLLVGAVFLDERQVDDGIPRLFDWQISAFYDMKPTDQAIYTALSTAAEELWWIHSDYLRFGISEGDPWPTVEELDRDYLLPPFAKDISWSQQGEVMWQRVASYSFEGSTVYHGTGGTVPGQSAYLIMLSHVHKGASYANGATIWVHPDASAPEPPTIKRDSLIINGWKEVVPYSGATEVERLKGA